MLVSCDKELQCVKRKTPEASVVIWREFFLGDVLRRRVHIEVGKGEGKSYRGETLRGAQSGGGVRGEF